MAIFTAMTASFVLAIIGFQIFGRSMQKRFVLPAPYFWAPNFALYVFLHMLFLPLTHLPQGLHSIEVFREAQCAFYHFLDLGDCTVTGFKLGNSHASQLNTWDYIYMAFSSGAFLGSLWIIPREQSHPDRRYKFATEISLAGNLKYLAMALSIIATACIAGNMLSWIFAAP